MNKLDIAIKGVACLVVGFIFAGLANAALMQKFMPVILGGTVVVLVLYTVNAFHKKNYAKIITILVLAAFVMAIAGYNMFK